MSGKGTGKTCNHSGEERERSKKKDKDRGNRRKNKEDMRDQRAAM